MTKHTTGPWDFAIGDKERRSTSAVHKKGQPDFPIAHVICESSNEFQRKEDIANARLIAVAPDLLEALKECVTSSNCNAIAANDTASMIRRFEEINRICHEAIAKAEAGGK